MAIGERDPHTGHMTTGHEWNGIKELNTPVPRAVFFFLVLTFAFSLVYWVLMPSFPVGRTYMKGALGIDQRGTVAQKLEAASAERAAWTAKIESEDFAAIAADPALMRIVRETGKTLFGDNCAACHGRNAEGGKGYPSLADAAWLWGGDAATVAETIRVGINSGHADARTSQMLAFGRDGTLDRAAIRSVAAYVQSLSNPALAKGDEAAAVATGKEVFAANCVACHGEDGKGSTEAGAPNLTDAFWIYGGDRQSIFTTIYGGRQGVMPSWEQRLSPLDRKILTLYVLDLGKGGR
jgi:cytochrome c oxidase cbb3-type subunit 3